MSQHAPRGFKIWSWSLCLHPTPRIPASYGLVSPYSCPYPMSCLLLLLSSFSASPVTPIAFQVSAGTTPPGSLPGPHYSCSHGPSHPVSTTEALCTQ